MNAENLRYHLINSEGLYTLPEYDMPCSTVLHDNIFDNDALILENSGVSAVSLSDGGKKYLTVRFDAKVFGIWSPAKKNAPFVCIEPWVARPSRSGEPEDIMEKADMIHLQRGEGYRNTYVITVE